jgi:hypothetical protein
VPRSAKWGPLYNCLFIEETTSAVIPAKAGIHGDVSKINDLERYSSSAIVSRLEIYAQLARRIESARLVIPAKAGIQGDVSKINDLESYSLSTMDSRSSAARFILSLAKGGNDGKGSCAEASPMRE